MKSFNIWWVIQFCSLPWHHRLSRLFIFSSTQLHITLHLLHFMRTQIWKSHWNGSVVSLSLRHISLRNCANFWKTIIVRVPHVAPTYLLTSATSMLPLFFMSRLEHSRQTCSRLFYQLPWGSRQTGVRTHTHKSATNSNYIFINFLCVCQNT